MAVISQQGAAWSYLIYIYEGAAVRVSDCRRGVLALALSSGCRTVGGSLALADDHQQGGRSVISSRGGGSLSSGSAGRCPSWCRRSCSRSSGSRRGVLHGQQVAGCPDDHQQGGGSCSLADDLGGVVVVVSRWSAGQQVSSSATTWAAVGSLSRSLMVARLAHWLGQHVRPSAP